MQSKPSSDLSDISQVIEAADIFIFWISIWTFIGVKRRSDHHPDWIKWGTNKVRALWI